jgi:hypothetical protein
MRRASTRVQPAPLPGTVVTGALRTSRIRRFLLGLVGVFRSLRESLRFPWGRAANSEVVPIDDVLVDNVNKRDAPRLVAKTGVLSSSDHTTSSSHGETNVAKPKARRKRVSSITELLLAETGPSDVSASPLGDAGGSSSKTAASAAAPEVVVTAFRPPAPVDGTGHLSKAGAYGLVRPSDAERDSEVVGTASMTAPDPRTGSALEDRRRSIFEEVVDSARGQFARGQFDTKLTEGSTEQGGGSSERSRRDSEFSVASNSSRDQSGEDSDDRDFDAINFGEEEGFATGVSSSRSSSRYGSLGSGRVLQFDTPSTGRLDSHSIADRAKGVSKTAEDTLDSVKVGVRTKDDQTGFYIPTGETTEISLKENAYFQTGSFQGDKVNEALMGWYIATRKQEARGEEQDKLPEGLADALTIKAALGAESPGNAPIPTGFRKLEGRFMAGRLAAQNKWLKKVLPTGSGRF